MNWPLSYLLRQPGFCLVAVVCACAPAIPLAAGEAIVFGSAKSTAEPNKDRIQAHSPLNLEKLTAPAPIDFGGIMPIAPRLEVNPRKDKRQRNAADEKRNWMFLEKGELDSKDAEKDFLGVRDDDPDDMDKGKDRRDFTFKDAPRPPGQPRLPGARRMDAKQPPPRQTIEDESQNKRESRSSAIVFGDTGKQAGGRIGGDLDLQGVLGKGSDRSGDNSSFSLREFLSAGDSGREQQIRTESFKQLLSGPSSFGGLSDPVNLHSDFTRQSINPVMPSFGSSWSKSPDNGYLIPRQSLSTPNNSPNFLSSPDVRARPSSDFGSSTPAPGGWKPTEVQWPRSRF